VPSQSFHVRSTTGCTMLPESGTVARQGMGFPFKRLRADDPYRARLRWSLAAIFTGALRGRLWKGFQNLCRSHYGSPAPVGRWRLWRTHLAHRQNGYCRYSYSAWLPALPSGFSGEAGCNSKTRAGPHAPALARARDVENRELRGPPERTFQNRTRFRWLQFRNWEPVPNTPG
jgi:hypothetical protein